MLGVGDHDRRYRTAAQITIDEKFYSVLRKCFALVG